MTNYDDDSIKELLLNSAEDILEKLKQVNANHAFSYETFGKDIEQHINMILKDILESNGIINTDNDYHIAQNKNEFPDFTINCNQKIAIEYKSGNHRKKSGNQWVDCKNSNNDLGTLRSWDQKLTDFNGENILFLYVEYSFDDVTKKIIDVKIDNFYKFLKVNGDGILRYRKKDGNLRPKDFNEGHFLNSFEEFMALLTPTKIYRAKSIITEHIETIPEDQRDELLESLKSK
jgi:hypothetical protein